MSGASRHRRWRLADSRRRQGVALLFAWLLAWLCLAAVGAPVRPRGTATVIRDDGSVVHFSVEIATSEAQRRQGLMQRDVLPRGHGMWFDFGRSHAVSMWMKNTRIALDIVFIDDAGDIVAVRRGEPLDTRLIASPGAIRYVLEINAGEAEMFGLAPGNRALLRRD